MNSRGTNTAPPVGAQTHEPEQQHTAHTTGQTRAGGGKALLGSRWGGEVGVSGNRRRRGHENTPPFYENNLVTPVPYFS